MAEESRPIRSYSLQVGGEDLTKDSITPNINHHLVLILAEILDQITLIRVAVKYWNREFLRKFTFQYSLREGRVGCIDVDGSEFAVGWHFCLLDLLM